MAYVSKSGKRRTVSPAKAQQFDKMAENWVRNAERSGNPNDYAIAAKQALVSAFYWKHAGDDVAASQQMDRADWAIEHSKGATDKRTLKWIMQNRAKTRSLVEKGEGKLAGLRGGRHVIVRIGKSRYQCRIGKGGVAVGCKRMKKGKR